MVCVVYVIKCSRMNIVWPHQNVLPKSPLLISVCLLLIQWANRCLCVFVWAKPVYTASDLWGCCMKPHKWALFPQFSPPLSIKRHWVEKLLNSWWKNFGQSFGIPEKQDVMSTTIQREPECLDKFKIIYNAFVTAKLPDTILSVLRWEIVCILKASSQDNMERVEKEDWSRI